MRRYRRAADQHRVAWRNGAGLTTELASDPPGGDAEAPPSGGSSADFSWRVSLAEVTEDCEFSVFPDVDRTIVLVEGEAMSLQLPGIAHTLTPYEPFQFDGAVEVRCRVSGPTRDLNVMTRRGRSNATVSIEKLDAPLTLAEADPLVIVCLDGSVTLETEGPSVTLGAGDVAELDERVRAVGNGHVAVIRIETLER
ncbi:HutD/Ves family protein [Kribbella sp. DT2]|uniref:HutD/Ves family protein n=1 Tax=Kribbella sp. DT2 TaxID=3393427 RepID=UPI003CEFE551